MLSIILPTYNERENLRELIERIYKTLRNTDFEIIIVDDNSPDGTADFALELSKIYDKIKVIKRKKKLGINSAFLTGYLNSKGKYIVLMDADLQHPPEKIKEILENLERGYDIVVASRFLKDSKTYGLPFYRKLISISLSKIIRATIPKIKVRDPLSGFFGAKREVIEKTYEKIKFKRGWKILIEILANSENIKIKEIPFSFEKRKYGKSKVNSIVIVELFKQIIYYSDIIRIIEFSIVGIIGIFVNLLVLYLLRSIGIPHFTASAIAIEASIINNFLLNNYWTFSDRSGGFLKKIIEYHIVSSISSLIQYFVSNLIFYFIYPNSIISQLVGIVSGYLINLFGSFKFVWKK